jgi:hypothetical protein
MGKSLLGCGRTSGREWPLIAMKYCDNRHLLCTNLVNEFYKKQLIAPWAQSRVETCRYAAVFASLPEDSVRGVKADFPLGPPKPVSLGRGGCHVPNSAVQPNMVIAIPILLNQAFGVFKRQRRFLPNASPFQRTCVSAPAGIGVKIAKRAIGSFLSSRRVCTESNRFSCRMQSHKKRISLLTRKNKNHRAIA